jgi:hypothetical protein
LSAIKGLAAPACGLSDGSVAGDWRMPNVKELQSLIHFDFTSPALSNAAGTSQWAPGDPFSNLCLGNCRGYFQLGLQPRRGVRRSPLHRGEAIIGRDERLGEASRDPSVGLPGLAPEDEQMLRGKRARFLEVLALGPLSPGVTRVSKIAKNGWTPPPI